uniref:Putative secreted peptide n=1 Tax=Anopheles braziliensis TaxID=58242 RepID=A0A2M3ZM92_9DIPT
MVFFFGKLKRLQRFHLLLLPAMLSAKSINPLVVARSLSCAGSSTPLWPWDTVASAGRTDNPQLPTLLTTTTTTTAILRTANGGEGRLFASSGVAWVSLHLPSTQHTAHTHAPFKGM